MPELDYVLLADYVRQDSGTVHIMAAGLDTIQVPGSALPTVVPIGLAARITFSSEDEVGATNEFSFVVSGPSGDLMKATQHFQTPPPVPGVPPHWRTAVGLAVRMPLLIPSHGNYALQVMLNDDPRLSRRLDLRAIEPVSG
jgi:hypothetical protein